MKRLYKSKEERIRELVGLPNEDIFKARHVTIEDIACENTFSYAPPVKDGYKALNSIFRLAPENPYATTGDGVSLRSEVGAGEQRDLVKHKVFDYGASGGASAPNTEVNAENQGVISEVPRTDERPRQSRASTGIFRF